MQDIHKVQQVLWLTTTYIIYSIWWNGQPILTVFTLRSTLHHAHYSFYDIINIGKVTATVAIVENLNGLPFQQFIGETEVRHIRTTGRTINSEEAQTRSRDVIQLAVAMCKKFVALLRGSIQADRIVHAVVCREWHLLVATINATRRSIDQVCDGIVATSFQNIVEAYHITHNVSIRILYRIAHARLSSQIHYHVKLILSKQLVNRCLVS